MPTKNISAVQRITQSLRTYQRKYSGRTLLGKSYDAMAMSSNFKDRRTWPEREETYAADQILRQNRTWSVFRKFGSGGHANTEYMVRRSPTPRRNNILAAKSASTKRSAIKRMQRQEAQSYESQMRNVKDEEARREKDESEESTDSGKRPKDDEEENVEIRSVRDIVFGVPDKDDETDRQRRADDELLNRVVKQKPDIPDIALSKKVIAPYLTYKTHRSSWAEFRHRMIYGASNF